MSMRRLHPMLLTATALLAIGGCDRASKVPSGPSAAPSSNIYLRNSFDTDPSVYLGRFVPAGAVDLDEGSAMPLLCSQYVAHRFIDAGGVKVTETMNVSTQVAARLGVPMMASVSGAGSNTAEVRVAYTLTGKMVAEITDPAAFDQCCRQSPDQCTSRFIGEFMQGTGAVYRSAAESANVNATGTDPNSGVSGGVSVDHDKNWVQAIEFPNPVYFAFKVTHTPNMRVASSCGAWVDAPPTQPGYVFFSGQSRPVRNERSARQQATRRAQWKAMMSVMDPVSADVDAEIDPATEENNAEAQKWAFGMQVVESCVERVPGDRGDRYVGRVLGKLPEFRR